MASEQELFIGALNLGDPAERRAFLHETCGADSALRGRVEALLAVYEGAGSFLESPVVAPTVAVAPPASPAEGAGTVIGPYKLLQVIGEGGMGTVYMAEQTEPVRRLVALKLVKDGMDGRQVLARFGAERQALALMDHPNIAKVLDAGTTERGRPYFVMELVKGVPITRFCDEHRLSTRDRIELAVPVCQAVQHAHQKGVIHRDLKPSNVLVALYDDKPVPKVIDFGVAKATGARLTDQTLFTEFGSVVGTLEYMSPEQARLNQLDVDTRSDVYSLGVLIYELLTGSTPLERERITQAAFLEVLRVIREEESPWPSVRLSTTAELPNIAANRGVEPRKLSGLVRGELDWIVMRALEKDRDRRYETANGLAADLRRYLDDEPVQACPPSVRYRFGKFARRHRVGLAGAGVVVLALLVSLGSVAGSFGWAVRDRQTRQAAMDREVIRALEDVASWRRRDDLPEAQAALKRSEGLLAGGGASEEARRQVQSWRTDLGRAARLEEILFSFEGDPSSSARLSEAAYTKVFAELGIDIERTDAVDAARIIGSQRIRDAWLNALDDWSDKRHDLSLSDPGLPKEWWQRPMAVARSVDPDGFSNRVRLAVERGDWAEVDRLARDPGVASLSVGALRLLTRAMFWNNVPDGRERAMALLNNALIRDPGNFRLHYTQARYNAPGLQGRPGEFLRYAQSALALRPHNAPVTADFAVALQGQGKNDEAAAWFRRAIELDPKNAIAHNNFGATLVRQGKVDEAIAFYRRAIELDPKYATAHNNLGNASSREGKVDEAIAFYRRAIELDPKNAMAHNNLGAALTRQGKLDEAVACFRRSIGLDPKSPNAHSNLGAQLARQGKDDEAVACFRKAIEVDPKFTPAYANLGESLSRQGKVDEAVATYHKALEREPKHATLLNDLAWLLATTPEAEVRDSRRAAELARQAVQLAPQVGGFRNTLGVALYRNGEWPTAIESLKKSAELSGPNAVDGFFLAMAHWRLGDRPQARSWYDNAVRWMEKSQPANREVLRFRDEAAALLEVKATND